MTIPVYFLPMPIKLTIAILTYDETDVLDVTGPTSVFAEANRKLGRQAYDIRVLSPSGGPIVDRQWRQPADRADRHHAQARD